MWNVAAIKKMKMSQRKWCQQKKKSTLELSRAFHSVESTKDKILEADSNLGSDNFPGPQKDAFPVS